VNSEQLELALSRVLRKAEEPWGGQSPRVLTKSYGLFRFRPQGMGRLDLEASHVGDHKSEVELEQLDLFL